MTLKLGISKTIPKCIILEFPVVFNQWQHKNCWLCFSGYSGSILHCGNVVTRPRLSVFPFKSMKPIISFVVFLYYQNLDMTEVKIVIPTDRYCNSSIIYEQRQVMYEAHAVVIQASRSFNSNFEKRIYHFWSHADKQANRLHDCMGRICNFVCIWRTPFVEFLWKHFYQWDQQPCIT